MAWTHVDLFSIKEFPYICYFPDLYFRPSDSSEKRAERAQINEQIDEKYGFYRHKDPVERVGWLINMHPVSCVSFFFQSCLLFWSILKFWFFYLHKGLHLQFLIHTQRNFSFAVSFLGGHFPFKTK